MKRVGNGLVVGLLALAAGAITFAAGPHPGNPIRTVLPRDGIPALFRPRFVPAEEVQIADGAHVIGVSIGGESRAYSINLLDNHEIVNDVVGGRPIAVTW